MHVSFSPKPKEINILEFLLRFALCILKTIKFIYIFYDKMLVNGILLNYVN